MAEPLTKSQQSLRGRRIVDLTDDQLHEWIDACKKMEDWVGHAKSRRAWRLSAIEAEAELERRNGHGALK
jgi:hypothetical protein